MTPSGSLVRGACQARQSSSSPKPKAKATKPAKVPKAKPVKSKSETPVKMLVWGFWKQLKWLKCTWFFLDWAPLKWLRLLEAYLKQPHVHRRIMKDWKLLEFHRAHSYSWIFDAYPSRICFKMRWPIQSISVLVYAGSKFQYVFVL